MLYSHVLVNSEKDTWIENREIVGLLNKFRSFAKYLKYTWWNYLQNNYPTSVLKSRIYYFFHAWCRFFVSNNHQGTIKNCFRPIFGRNNWVTFIICLVQISSRSTGLKWVLQGHALHLIGPNRYQVLLQKGVLRLILMSAAIKVNELERIMSWFRNKSKNNARMDVLTFRMFK